MEGYTVKQDVWSVVSPNSGLDLGQKEQKQPGKKYVRRLHYLPLLLGWSYQDALGKAVLLKRNSVAGLVTCKRKVFLG